MENTPILFINTPNIIDLFYSIQEVARIDDVMIISGFLNPEEEIVEDLDLGERDIDQGLNTIT